MKMILERRDKMLGGERESEREKCSEIALRLEREGGLLRHNAGATMRMKMAEPEEEERYERASVKRSELNQVRVL